MSAPEKLTPVFWLTRDRMGGVLSEVVEVWSARPQRVGCEDEDVLWLPPDEHLLGEAVDVVPSCLGEWTLAEARARIGNGVPETDRECTRCGDPLPV